MLVCGMVYANAAPPRMPGKCAQWHATLREAPHTLDLGKLVPVESGHIVNLLHIYWKCCTVSTLERALVAAGMH